MIIEKVALPSNGLLGYAKEVEISELSGLGLTSVYESLTDASIDFALSSALRGVEVSELCDEDKLFLLLKARVLTIDSVVVQPVISPYTGNVQPQEVDLTQFSYTALTQEMLDETITIKDIKGKEYTFSRRVATKEIIESLLKTKEKNLLSDRYIGILRIVSKLSPIVNGENKPTIETIQLLADSIPGTELLKLYKFADNLVFGLDLTYTATCKETNQEFLGVFGLSADLFR